MCRIFTSISLFLAVGFLRTTNAQSPQKPIYAGANSAWVDSVMASLSPDERIGQLLMVAAYSDSSRSAISTAKSSPDSVEKYIREYHVGGVVFFQGGPMAEALLTNRYQAAAKVPLLIAMDAEYGLAMRLDSTVRYPYQMTLGAIQGNNHLIYGMGRQLARQARRLGIHVNFAPVVDVNNNPENPVINFRSFGENKYKVTDKARAFMKGMQENGLLTSAKHFPGHGDTGTDSHYALPVINGSRKRIDSLELYPFRMLINEGLSGVMVAHLSVPALDSASELPSTLSRKIVNGLLRKELGFEGIIYSDAMNMKGLTRFYTDGTADAKALEAGMDVLEFVEDVPKAIAEIKKAVAEGLISQQEIDEKCRKMLEAKAWAELDNFQPVDTTNLVKDLNPREAELTNRLLTEKALTVLRNKEGALPLKNLDSLSIAAVSLGADTTTIFQKTLALYAPTTNFWVPDSLPANELSAMMSKLDSFDIIVTGVHLSSISPYKNYGLTPTIDQALKLILKKDKAVVTLFGNVYSLGKIAELDHAKAIIMAYQLTRYAQELSAQLVFGAIPSLGKLPVTVNEKFRLDDGISLPSIGRLKYTIPEELGLDSNSLGSKIDSIMLGAIADSATPGAEVQLAKDGKVFFRKAYGKPTYESSDSVRLENLYDLASLTKITAATPALLKLYDQGRFDLDATMKDYLPNLRKSNKADLTWRRVLTHDARLKSWIQFWREAQRKSGKWRWNTFKTRQSKKYPTSVVGDSLFIHRNYARKILKSIRKSPLNPEEGYVYSDLSFILYPTVVKNITGEDFERFIKQNFYNKIGASSLTFNPLRFYKLDDVMPSEVDTFFRHTLIRGQVHDEGAAMLGGLSGHAGLFGNANDLMKMWQVYLQNGYYGGEQLISRKALAEFTRYQFPEIGLRRGIAFDKPSFHYTGNAPRLASPRSYGHTGFTGTMVWIDPAWGFNFVVLTNRVYPTRLNNKLSSLNVRTGIMDEVYKMFMKKALGAVSLSKDFP